MRQHNGKAPLETKPWKPAASKLTRSIPSSSVCSISVPPSPVKLLSSRWHPDFLPMTANVKIRCWPAWPLKILARSMSRVSPQSSTALLRRPAAWARSACRRSRQLANSTWQLAFFLKSREKREIAISGNLFQDLLRANDDCRAYGFKIGVAEKGQAGDSRQRRSG
jgi:hypothetical protein